jgi:hypothetical protein
LGGGILKRIKKLVYVIIASLSLSIALPTPSINQVSAPVIVQAKTTTVYVTPTGKKYHKKKCGNGKYTKSTLEKAKKAGLTPCKKCY